MPSVYFKDFEILWVKVEGKFTTENNCVFTLDDLHSYLISQNLINPQTYFKETIQDKFLKYIDSVEKPQNVNLPDTIFKALYKYVDIRGIADLRGNTYIDSKEAVKKIKQGERTNENKFHSRETNLAEIGFLGREKELSELEDFLKSPEHRIFALYGVPMIGKTKLVNHFLENNETAKTYKTITVKLNPNNENAEQRIKNEVFGDKDFNDFSDFSSNTIIVIQNFEETLELTSNSRKFHDIEDRYKNIKTFLEKASAIDSIKLILESRFQILFELFLADWRTKVKTLSDVKLEGIKSGEFWQFYRSKGFNRKQFETLCKNFDYHTGLLALAYNNFEAENLSKLIEAYYQPDLVTIELWDLIEKIVDRLENREIWLLCALTFLQEPVRKENLYEDFLTLPDFEDEFQIRSTFNSLVNKLLVQLDKGNYDLNPYIREVCYTFLKVRKRITMLNIKNLPYFKKHGKTPYYDEIRQAQEKGDFRTFFRLIKENRQKRNYKEVHSHLQSALLDPLFKKIIVLTEIGITYKQEGEIDKAIEVLKKAKEIDPRDVKTLDEMAICYRKLGKIEIAIELLEEAENIDPENHQTLNELIICYQRVENYADSIKIAKKLIEQKDYIGYTDLATTYQKMGDLEMAYQVAEEGMKTSGWDKSRLTKKFHELKELLNQQKQDEKDKKKLKVFLSYSHKDEDIKEELDTQLSALKRSDKISTWNDRELPAGAEWDKAIKAELENADIVLLLISANFIASNYIWDIEIKKAIEKHENGTAVVIPIFCRSCDFDDMPFAKLQGLPKDAKFISSQPDKDQAYTEVAKGIRKIVESRFN